MSARGCRPPRDVPLSRSAQGVVDLCTAELGQQVCNTVTRPPVCAIPPPPGPPPLTGEEAVGAPIFGLCRERPAYPCLQRLQQTTCVTTTQVPQPMTPPPSYPVMYQQYAQGVMPPPPSVPGVAPPPMPIPDIPMTQQPMPAQEWHQQWRTLEFQWNMSLDELAKRDVVSCTESILTQAAINKLAYGQSRTMCMPPGMAPAYIVPEKIYIRSVFSDCPIALLIKAPWIREQHTVVNNGQTGLILVRPGSRIYGKVEGRIYELSAEDFRELNGLKLLLGKTASDFGGEYSMFQNQPDTYMIPQGKTLHTIFDLTRTIDPNRAKVIPGGLSVARNDFETTYRQIESDVKFCNEVAPLTSSIKMTIEPVRSSRCTVGTVEPHDAARLIRDSLSGISGGEADALAFYMNKHFTVMVELSMQYKIYC